MNRQRLIRLVLSTALFTLPVQTVFGGNSAVAQQVEPSALSTSAFADLYIGHDFNNLPTRNRAYTTQARYSDELALNLGYVDAKLASENYRGRIALQHGSSVIANYGAEPDLFFRYIQESYLGTQIAPNLWIDAGIFLSHIGIESWISKDNWTYTRSFIAENSPYYQSGVRATYKVNENLDAQLHLMRGWQNISADKAVALGTQVKYVPSSALTLLHNTFLGDEHGKRFFNNFIAQYDITSDLSIAGSYDVGVQERRQTNDNAFWHGWAAFARYKLTDKTRIAARAEHYMDPHQVIIASAFDGPICVTGLSTNIDVDLYQNLLWRTEYRALIDTNQVFPNGSHPKDTNHLLVTSLAVTFG